MPFVKRTVSLWESNPSGLTPLHPWALLIWGERLCSLYRLAPVQPAMAREVSTKGGRRALSRKHTSAKRGGAASSKRLSARMRPSTTAASARWWRR